jgi:predicted deacylase
MIHGESPRGALRWAAAKKGIPTLLYEAGETHRLDEGAIDLGVRGVLRVLRELDMYRAPRIRGARESLETTRRTWVRARASGLVHLEVATGEWVAKGQRLGEIRDVFGDRRGSVVAPAGGLVIGHTLNPLVNRGDALVHLARDIVRRAE